MTDSLMATRAGTSPETPASQEPADRTCVDCMEGIRDGQEWFDRPHGVVCWSCWDVRYRR